MLTLGQYLQNSKPTKKQLELVYAIEDIVGPIWKGNTKEDASKYISENIDIYIKEVELQAELEAVVFESEHGDWGDRN